MLDLDCNPATPVLVIRPSEADIDGIRSLASLVQADLATQVVLTATSALARQLAVTQESLASLRPDAMGQLLERH